MKKISIALIACLLIMQLVPIQANAAGNSIETQYRSGGDNYSMKINFDSSVVTEVQINYPRTIGEQTYSVNSGTTPGYFNKTLVCNGTVGIEWLDSSGSVVQSASFESTEIQRLRNHCANSDGSGSETPYVEKDPTPLPHNEMDSDTKPSPGRVDLEDLEPEESLSGDQYDDFKSNWNNQEITDVDVTGTGEGTIEFFDESGNSLGSQDLTEGSSNVNAPPGTTSYEIKPDTVHREQEVNFERDPENPDKTLWVDEQEGETINTLDLQCTEKYMATAELDLRVRDGNGGSFSSGLYDGRDEYAGLNDYSGTVDVSGYGAQGVKYIHNGSDCTITGYTTTLDGGETVNRDVDFSSTTPYQEEGDENVPGNYESTGVGTTNPEYQDVTFKDESGNYEPIQRTGETVSSGETDPIDETCENILDIPPEYLPLYKEAANDYGINWTILASIHKIETSFSTIDPMVSSVGAEGHMQFMSATWAGWQYDSNSDGLVDDGVNYTDPSVIAEGGGYGIDANGDGVADPFNIQDAVYSAAYFIADHGGSEGEVYDAVFAYNHADWYVEEVLDQADMYDKKAVECGQDPINSPITDDSCAACKVFECPGWDEHMSKLEEIKNKIPPPPDWEKVAQTFNDKIVPNMVDEMENMLGTAPEGPSVPDDVYGLDDRGITEKEPEMQDVPGLGEAGFTADDVKQQAPEIEFREDQSGGFDIKNPVDSMPDMPGSFPQPGQTDPGEWGQHQPKEQSATFPEPTGGGDVPTSEAPMPSDSTNEAPMPSDGDTTAPTPDGTTEGSTDLQYYKSTPD